MVYLERVVMQGFKSFKRKVSIPFTPGFSVVIGPNGSGKSNICDAVTFVIGRPSSRAMRAKKATELIFHGSKSKGGSDFAVVTLFFSNTDRALPLEEDLVTVSRRINKGGVSTFRLNGRIVTRQEIADIFMKAGIHPSGHNILQQGDVTSIVEMDPVQRRQMLDEVSGILEYDDKRDKALKELKRIGDRVREAELILNEKAQTIGRISKERDAALQFQDLDAQLRDVKSAILMKEFSGSEKDLQAIQSKLDERNKQADEHEQTIKETDAGITEEEQRLADFTKSILSSDDAIEVTRKLARLQAEVERKRDKIESNTREIDRIMTMAERMFSLAGKAGSQMYEKVKHIDGVHGTFAQLIQVPETYKIATEVAAGGHLQDIVVDTADTAVQAVRYLKQNKLGRARFLPLDKLRMRSTRFLPNGTAGWLSDLMKYEQKYAPAVEYVLGTTAAVEDIGKAREIMRSHRVRMATLDGDLVEASGVVTGGYYRKKEGLTIETKSYQGEKKELEKENKKFEEEIALVQKEIEIYAEKERKTSNIHREKERLKMDEDLKKLREKRKKLYEQRLTLQQDIGRLNISKARLEATFDNLKMQLNEEGSTEKLEEKLKPLIENTVDILRGKEKELIQKVNGLGPVNLKAIDEYKTLKTELDDFRQRVDKIVEEKTAIEDSIQEIDSRKMETFQKTLLEVGNHFDSIYKQLHGGGEATLSLEQLENMENGLQISAKPPGKKLLSIDALSGGEKSLTAFSLLFALQRYKPSPFYILDEADAALDKTNTKKVSHLIRMSSENAQFIIISHNDDLVREADQVYGVSMENGESKLLGIKLPQETVEETAMMQEVAAKAPEPDFEVV
ncbi:MAG: chromosome segregation protein SMC [Nanoarchaeota archaeon]|nr:chromosome segregation protein SMC [Nanoarchaeota archaeon]